MHVIAHGARESFAGKPRVSLFRLAAAVVALMLALASWAQVPPVDCSGVGQALVTVPEIARDESTGVLRGTIYATSERVRMPIRNAAPLGAAAPVCTGQVVRAYRLEAPVANAPASELLDPMPGPTLRARVGDLIQLTFLNHIDPNRFAKSSETDCDRTSTYPISPPDPVTIPPTPPPDPDTPPNCFKGSMISNIHFHGTHTNPRSTGDNVFLLIHPSPRTKDAARTPVVTQESVGKPIAEFFARCEEKLKLKDSPLQWPRVWNDFPAAWRDMQQQLLTQYAPALWTENEKLIEEGNWPQNFLGAYPYCYRLPDYTASKWPPEPATAHGAHAASPQPDRPLIMGQTPGTHWYHAHKHGSTTINVLNGMTGVFIIEGKYDDDINRVYGEDWTRKQPVLVINQLGAVPNLMVDGGQVGNGPDFSVNGRLRPTISMKPGEVQMWRIANTSSRSGVLFLPPNGVTWRQIAQDGVQYSDANYRKSASDLRRSFLLAAGNRADLLVKAPPYDPAGSNTYPVVVNNTVDPSDLFGAAAITLLTVNVTNEPDAKMDFLPSVPCPVPPTDPCPFPSYLADIQDSEIKAPPRTLVFASSKLTRGVKIANHPSHQTIDGKKFDGEVGVSVALNKAEEWKVVNETYPPWLPNQPTNRISHPFHIHINPFQIVEVFDPNAKLDPLPGSGSVATTAGSAIVTVTGTAFTTQLHIGDVISIAGEAPATITLITPTSLTLSANAAVTKDGRAYTYGASRYIFDKDQILLDGQCRIDPFTPDAWKPCGPTVPATDRIWWDVFPIPSGALAVDSKGAAINDPNKPSTDPDRQIKIPGYFRMRSRFVDYSGHYVLHCHILAHEDRGMMTVVEVRPPMPYSHH